MQEPKAARDGLSWWYLLFVVVIVVSLWPPLYNRLEPSWFGMPFFYWFQLALTNYFQADPF